jgi:hypothetical protein
MTKPLANSPLPATNYSHESRPGERPCLMGQDTLQAPHTILSVCLSVRASFLTFKGKNFLPP